jgi:hypothetical protein
MAGLGRDALIGSQVAERTATLRFAAGDGIPERVEAIAEAEPRCCAFLTLRVTDEPNVVVLTIDGPDGAKIVVCELVDAFSGIAEPAP